MPTKAKTPDCLADGGLVGYAACELGGDWFGVVLHDTDMLGAVLDDDD
jgi:hypothetical protein